MNSDKKVSFNNDISYIQDFNINDYNKNITSFIINDHNNNNNIQSKLNSLHSLFRNFIKDKRTHQYYIKLIKQNITELNDLLQQELYIDSIIPTSKKDPFRTLCTFIMIYNYKCPDDNLLLSIVDNLFIYFKWLLIVYKCGTNQISEYLYSIKCINNLLDELVFRKDLFDNNYIDTHKPYNMIIDNLRDYWGIIKYC